MLCPCKWWGYPVSFINQINFQNIWNERQSKNNYYQDFRGENLLPIICSNLMFMYGNVWKKPLAQFYNPVGLVVRSLIKVTLGSIHNLPRRGLWWFWGGSLSFPTMGGLWKISKENDIEHRGANHFFPEERKWKYADGHSYNSSLLFHFDKMSIQN